MMILIVAALLIVSLVAFIKNCEGVTVLLYHKIAVPDERTPQRYRHLYVWPGNFEKHVQYLCSKGYQFISLEEFEKYLKGLSRSIHKKSVIISFDDGYLDNYTNAFPIMSSYGARAVIFVVSGFIGKETPWNGVEEQFLGKVHIQEMAANGIEFGAHTRSHKSLVAYAPVGDKEIEINGSKDALKSIVNNDVVSFSYPFGSYNQETINIVKRFFRLAFSMHRGINKPGTDPYKIRRMRPSNSPIGFRMLFILAPIYETLRSILWWKRYE